MDSKFKGNGISLGFSGSAAASNSPLLHKELHLLYRQRRYICSCGHTFNEKSPFAAPYFQTSSSLQQVMLQELRQHLSFQEVARRCHVSTSQVIRVFNEVHIPRPSHLPRVLSIDEFKGNAAGQKYQVIITDSENKRIMDILPTRTTPALLQYFYQFPMSERRKVEFVTMDMSMQFRSVIKTIFPKARIVADRFHMIRLVQWAMERAYKAEQKRLCHHSRMVKSNKTMSKMCLRANIRIFQGASIQGSCQHFLGTFSMDRPGKKR